MSRRSWWIKDSVVDYCKVCGEPIYLMKSTKIEGITVEKWNCKHQYAVRVTKG